jgi:putative hydrolase of the HAD superfamily
VPVEVIFFDVGGVLLDMGGVDRRPALAQRLGMTPAALGQSVWDAIGSRNKDAMADVTERLAERLGISQAQVPQCLDDFSAHWTRNDQLVDFLIGLRDRYRLAVIGNIPASGRFSFETVLHLDDVFEAMFLSGELGVEKPDRRIYEIACSEMNIAPRDAIFVDDLPENVEGAKAFGISSHRHVRNEETIRWIQSQLAEVG